MAIKSYKILVDDNKLKKFLKKNARWDTIDIEVTYANSDGTETTMIACKTARSFKLFMLEQEFEAAGYDMTKIEEYGDLRYEEGDENGYDTGYSAGGENNDW